MFNKNQVGCFSGHRWVGSCSSLRSSVASLARSGVVFWGCGGAVGFDLLAGEAVLSLRGVLPVKLIMVLPCKGQEKYYSLEDKKRYYNLIAKADKVVYLSEFYYSGCMLVRNRHLVECSSVLVCYCCSSVGGTAHTVACAKAANLQIFNLALF